MSKRSQASVFTSLTSFYKDPTDLIKDVQARFPQANIDSISSTVRRIYTQGQNKPYVAGENPSSLFNELAEVLNFPLEPSVETSVVCKKKNISKNTISNRTKNKDFSKELPPRSNEGSYLEATHEQPSSS